MSLSSQEITTKVQKLRDAMNENIAPHDRELANNALDLVEDLMQNISALARLAESRT